MIASILLSLVIGAAGPPACGPYLTTIKAPAKASVSAVTKKRFRTRYDRHFKKAAKLHWGPFFDWRLLKAQAWSESRLRETVIARDGGMGLAQFMPRTSKWVARAAGVPNKPLHAKWAIHMQAYYMRWIFLSHRRAGFKGPDPECYALTEAGYNSGPGHARKAWRLAGKPKYWCLIARHYHRVTGRWSRITLAYLKRIKWAYLQMRKGR